MSVVQKDILNGWKEIAGYVGRDIRTVERWEKQRGLPVRRVPGAGRATVYARISELEEWLAGANTDSETEAPVVEAENGSDALTSSTEPSAGHFTDLPPKAAAASIEAIPPFSAMRIWASMAAAGLVVVVIAAGLWMKYSHHVASAAIQPAATSISSYRSNVPGVENLYLRGVYLCEQRTPDSLNRALDSFNEAIAKDSHYAPAYAGVAITYNLLREYSVMPDAVAYPKAQAAAHQAIGLDPNFAQAYASLGFVDYFWLLDAASADRDFKKAIALNPNLAQAHHWYGSVLAHQGRLNEALQELEIAQHLQPGSAPILTMRALAIGEDGQAEEARFILHDLLSQNAAAEARNSVTEHNVLATLSLLQPRNVHEFATQVKRAAEVRGDKEMLAYADTALDAYQHGGEQAMWRALLAHEEKKHPYPEDRTYRMVQAEAMLGETDLAFADLSRLVDKRDRSLIAFSVDPMLASLRGDPRFAQLRARLELAPMTS